MNSEQHAVSRGASNQQVARAGEHFVAAELNKRGAYTVTFAGNMPKIDLLACNSDCDRVVGWPKWLSNAIETVLSLLSYAWRFDQ